MIVKVLRIGLVALLLLAATALGAYLLVDAWLESAGGRQALEREMEARAGLAVQLRGEFEVMLLPSVGVSGTDLVLFEPGSMAEWVRGDTYSLALDLAALIHGRIAIESIRVAGGRVDANRWPEGAAGEPSPPVRLPEIAMLELADIEIAVSEGDEKPFLLRELRISGFAVGQRTAFLLDLRELGRWQGWFRWSAQDAVFEVEGQGAGLVPGAIGLHSTVHLNRRAGQARVDWMPEAGRPPGGAGVHLSTGFGWQDEGIRIDSLALHRDNESIEGSGCLILAEPTELHLDLRSSRLDLDQWPDAGALGGDSADGQQQAVPAWSYHLRLTVDELSGGGAIAREAELRLGGEPDCGALGTVPAH